MMPPWLKNLFPNRSSNPNVRFIAMMESGQLVDETAEIIQTQVIAHGARAAIRNRPTVPLYEHLEEGRMPVWKENVLVETGEAVAPGASSRYVLEDAPALWRGFKAGAIEVPGASKFKKNSVQLAVLGAGVLAFIGCLWLAAQPEDVTRPAAQAAQQPQDQPQQVEGDFGHGFVDDVADESGGEGRTGTGGGSGTGGAVGEGGS